MKKNIFLPIIALIFFAAPSIAQTNTWMIYANGSYDKVSFTPSPQFAITAQDAPTYITSWNANTGIGYTVSNHIMVGLQGGYGSQQVPDNIRTIQGSNSGYFANIQALNSWQAGAFCRYTSSLAKRFYVYAQFYAAKYGQTNNSENTFVPIPTGYATNPAIAPEGNGFIFNLFPAVGMNIVKGYGIHADIGGISYTTYNAISAATLHHFNVTLGQQFSFGIHKILGWKKRTDPAPAVPESKG